jgi:thiol-disulfide isomerase/thioredoxin
VLRAAAVVLVAFVVFPACKSGRPVPLPPVDKPLPLLARDTLAGQRFDPASVAGKVVVVNFWSPGCAPCAKEAPGLQAAADALADRGLALVTVMSDGTPDEARAFVHRAGLTAPVVVGDLDLLKDLNVLVYPWTLIVDRDGRAVYALRGGQQQATFTKAFEKYL